jgi:threonine dehydrogenase-like Zn-dependent dehydrogenase
LQLAHDGGAEVVNFEHTPDLIETLKELTGGRGPDACIDAVGMEAHGHGIDWYSDRAKQALGISFDRPFALRQCIQACRKGGTVSIPGVYGGFLNNFPMGAAFGKGLTFKMGQTNMMRYMKKLLDRVEQ